MIMIIAPLHICLLVGTLLLCLRITAQHEPMFRKDYTDSTKAKTDLYVFVGEKISVSQLPYQEASLDNGFRAVYRILQHVYGNYKADTIVFEAYDHNGVPPFSRFEYALLYVVLDTPGNYHEKYQFRDVYRTKNGRWAGTYSTYPEFSCGTPQEIDFLNEVSYPLAVYTNGCEPVCIEEYFPEPFYKKFHDRAVAVYGHYIEDLFDWARRGTLAERGYFGEHRNITPSFDSLRALIPAYRELKHISAFSHPLKKFMRRFIRAVNERDTIFLKKHLPDTVGWNSVLVSAGQLISQRESRIWDTAFLYYAMRTAKSSFIKYNVVYPHSKRRTKEAQVTFSSLSGAPLPFDLHFVFEKSAGTYQLASFSDPKDRIGRDAEIVEEAYLMRHYLRSAP
jgi:hypothetical protein